MVVDGLLVDLLDDWNGPVKVLRTGYLVAEEPPQTKQSTRFGQGRAWTDPRKAKYIRILVKHFRTMYSGPVLQGMLRLSILYAFPWTQKEAPFRRLGWAPTAKYVDVDNLLKPVKDSLKKIIMADDSQVVDVRARKIRYERGLVAVRVDEITADRSWEANSNRLDKKI